MLICRSFTGATGLEPATSGVTGRYELNRYDLLPPGITGYSRHFVSARTGCDPLRPAAARHNLCSTRVVGLVSDRATKSAALPVEASTSDELAQQVCPTDHRDEPMHVHCAACEETSAGGRSLAVVERHIKWAAKGGGARLRARAALTARGARASA